MKIRSNVVPQLSAPPPDVAPAAPTTAPETRAGRDAFEPTKVGAWGSDASARVTGPALERSPGFVRFAALDAAPACGAPYSAVAFGDALLAAVRGLDRATAEGFLSPYLMELYDDAKAGGAELLARGLYRTADELDQDIAASMEKPVAFLFSEGRGLGFVLFRGDVYQEGWFRRSRVDDASGAPPSTAELSRRQPWLAWDAPTKTFAARGEGAQERILSGLPASISLFRGASAEEAELIERARGAAHGRATPADGAPAGGSPAAAYAERFGDAHDAAFTTTDELAARKWASPALLRADHTRKELLELSRRGALYVGFEYEYTELAFVRGRGVDAFFRRAEVAESVAEKPEIPAFTIDNPDA